MIIIPARLNSSRFANKILVDILGLPMVIRTAKQVSSLDKVTIATDSQEVITLAKEHGINAVLTSTKHQSGTDRINEAAQILNLNENDIVINAEALFLLCSIFKFSTSSLIFSEFSIASS